MLPNEGRKKNDDDENPTIQKASKTFIWYLECLDVVLDVEIRDPTSIIPQVMHIYIRLQIPSRISVLLCKISTMKRTYMYIT